jgi:hypothetical protein
MNAFLEPDGRYTEEGVLLLRSVVAVLQPIFSEYLAKGYHRQDIAERIHEVVDFVARN